MCNGCASLHHRYDMRLQVVSPASQGSVGDSDTVSSTMPLRRRYTIGWLVRGKEI